MKALITGGRGFVGGHLKDYLSSIGFEVIATDKEDLNVLDRKNLFQFFKEQEFDHVYHLAGFTSPKNSFDHSEICKKINIEGTKNLLDAIFASGKKPKILIVSSAHVYGTPQYIPVDENHPLNPESPYAESRVEQERLALSYDLPIIISRSFNHTGPGQLEFICPDFAKQIIKIEKGIIKEPVIYVGDLSSRRDFTDVRDVVKAYHLALTKGILGKTYNICSGKSYTGKFILDTLLSYTDKEITIKTDHNKITKKDISLLQGDNTKFCNLTGWEPIIEFEQTLKDILDYWRKNIF